MYNKKVITTEMSACYEEHNMCYIIAKLGIRQSHCVSAEPSDPAVLLYNLPSDTAVIGLSLLKGDTLYHVKIGLF